MNTWQIGQFFNIIRKIDLIARLAKIELINF